MDVVCREARASKSNVLRSRNREPKESFVYKMYEVYAPLLTKIRISILMRFPGVNYLIRCKLLIELYEKNC